MQTETTPTTPRIWLVIGDKPGDNAQVEMIAEGLGLPFDIRRVLPKPEYVLGKPRFDVSLDHLDLEKSDALAPPWPDLILTIGRRPSMAALWVQQQSGGRSKIVLLGRPKRWKERFDLIIVPSQYRMPPESKVLQLELPLMRSNEAKVAAAADAWRERLADLPRPLTALLVGGQTKPFRFDADAARDLLQKSLQAAGDGFLYISTSRRTPPAVVDYLEQHLPANARLFRWASDAPDNPYLPLLGLADRFIVTGDSVSMMVEVARLGRPLAIYSLPIKHPVRWAAQQRVTHWLHGQDSSRILAKWLYKLGLVRYSRDLTDMHRLFYARDLAVPLGETFAQKTAMTLNDELGIAIERVRCLLNLR